MKNLRTFAITFAVAGAHRDHRHIGDKSIDNILDSIVQLGNEIVSPFNF